MQRAAVASTPKQTGKPYLSGWLTNCPNRSTNRSKTRCTLTPLFYSYNSTSSTITVPLISQWIRAGLALLCERQPCVEGDCSQWCVCEIAHWEKRAICLYSTWGWAEVWMHCTVNIARESHASTVSSALPVRAFGGKQNKGVSKWISLPSLSSSPISFRWIHNSLMARTGLITVDPRGTSKLNHAVQYFDTDRSESIILNGYEVMLNIKDKL